MASPTLDEAVNSATQTVNAPPETPPPGPKVVETPPPAPTKAETPQATDTPEPEDETSRLFLFTKPESEEKPEEVPPDDKEKGYLRHADYTRKTQELAEQRKAFEAREKTFSEREERLLKLLESRTPPGEDKSNGEGSVFDRVRQLREEGRHDDADKLLFEISRLETRKELEPVIKNAKVHELQSAFVNIAVQTAASNPAVQRYAKAVGQRFDGNEVLDAASGLTMGDLRKAVTSDLETMQRFVPVVMRALAAEEHARTLETNMAQMVKERVDNGLKLEKDRATKLPNRLVPSGSVPKVTGPGKMSLDEALSHAQEEIAARQ